MTSVKAKSDISLLSLPNSRETLGVALDELEIVLKVIHVLRVLRWTHVDLLLREQLVPAKGPLRLVSQVLEGTVAWRVKLLFHIFT